MKTRHSTTLAMFLLPLVIGSATAATGERFALPERMDTPQAMAARLGQLRADYAVFQHDFAPRLPGRARVALTPVTWLFRDDESDTGMTNGFFRADLPERGWEKRSLPEYREFALGWYRIHKTLPKNFAGKRVWLTFEGVDYRATVFVNGEKAGEHNGYFAPFSLDVTRLVRPGADNVVAVRVENPMDSAQRPDSFAGKGAGTMAFNKANGIIQYSNGAGIWQPVYFEATGPVAIRNVRITPALPDRAHMEVELDGEATGEVLLNAGPANFKGQPVTAKAQLKPGQRNCSFDLTLPTPRVWSPETPWLYFCQVTVRDSVGAVSDTHSEEFGLRTITRDGDGTLRLNGRPRLLRGACSFGNFWLDAAAGNRAGIIRDILIFKAANLEFTRVTVHVLPRLFYRLCDRYGLMVYEDTALQWDYPMDKDDRLLPEVREEAVRQLREMIAMLGNHPSIILWSCMNEFYPKSYPNADPVFRRAMFDAARAADPARPIVVNSGAQPLEGTDSEADVHSYLGWYGLTAAHGDPANQPDKIFFSPASKGIVSEYGGVGLPDWATWRERFPWAPQRADDFWTPRSILPEHIYRGLSFGDRVQAQCLTAQIGTHVRAADWIAASQHQQARLVRLNTDAWRKWRSHVAGYLFFHLIDPGPLAWPKTLVDCQRRPQAGYFELARASAPLRVNLFAPRARVFGGEMTEGLQLWVFNDSGAEFRGKARVLLLNEAGKIEDETNVEVNAPDFSSQQLTIRPLKTASGTKRENARLVALLEDAQGKLADFDDTPLTIFPRHQMPGLKVFVYDPKGDTLRAVQSLGVTARQLDTLSAETLAACRLLVVGENCLDPKVAAAFEVAKRGGRVVVLAQPGEPVNRKAAAKTPEPPSIWVALPLTNTIAAVNWITDFVQADTATAFLRGLLPQDFREWNGQAGAICHAGLTPHPDIVPLITTGMHQAHTALGLLPHGQGQIVFCQLLLAERAAHDPVAAEILARLVAPGKIAAPAILTMEIKPPLEAHAGKPMQLTATIANKGGEDGEVELFTLDDCYQPVAHRKLRVAAGETIHPEVHMDASSRAASAGTPDSVVFSSVSTSRGQSGALALAAGSRVTIVPLGGTVTLPPGEVVRRFDFGSPNSPVAKDYTPVTSAMRFDAARGFGWRSGNVESRDRGGPNDLVRDFHTSSTDDTFSVALSNGDYTCVVVIGDRDYPLHPIEIRAEGRIVVDGLTTRTGEFRTAEFRVKVTDGALDFDFHQRELGQKWEIGGLVIVKGTGRK